MVSIAAIAMSNYQMVYGGNDAAQTDNKFGVWFNVQRNPDQRYIKGILKVYWRQEHDQETCITA